jgi:hypothetical protein
MEYFKIIEIFLQLIWRVSTIMREYISKSPEFSDGFLISREGVFRQFSLSFPTMNKNHLGTNLRPSTTTPHSLVGDIVTVFLGNYNVYLRQYCVSLRRYCVFLRQYCVYIHQHCAFLRQYCVKLRQDCVFLRQYCVNLGQYCVLLRQYGQYM